MPELTVTLYSSSFCGACTSTRHTLDLVASVLSTSPLDDRITWREVNVADRPDESEQHRITSTPTVVMTGGDGTEVMRATGVPTSEQVLAAIAKNLA
ncbi:thioredoxin domain-containing protein [Amnibacterium flavum]|uniref:Thioredoxin n=1 Tax=Amnibacterium flavum TaxID=2173173 RepID=A0A2V1HMM9_9MICO|nr:thioredoxin domain-containing protein [Amnibacterium flavum]PVZ93873.1 thioredoxin [Amnibacterium flavum]